MSQVARKLLEEIRSGRITSQEQLEIEKIRLAGQYGIGNIIKNSDIASLLSPHDSDYQRIRDMLKIKNVRTASGVANIAVMWLYKSHAYSCPFQCIYCPQGKEKGEFIAPKSYTGVEPTTLRAIRNCYDPFLQVSNRVAQLNIIGHPTDKCELIIMGGTFMATPASFQDGFVKRCLDGFNGFDSDDLLSAQLVNETAPNRCVGLTIETRADFCMQQHIDQMLRLGCTRVEIGVQSTDEELLKITKRGHGTEANVEAIKRLKENGLKVCVHWMPGLTGLYGEIDEQEEAKMFGKLFTPGYMPDELKIYPTLVIPGTKLHELWQSGRYAPLAKDQMIRLLIEFKKIVPDFVRIKRVMRDISEHKASAGASTTNLRQLAKERMRAEGIGCRCIRCREIGRTGIVPKRIELCKTEYEASDGKEIFLSYEGSGSLLAFLRLRIDGSDTAKIRELHVYGSMVPIGRQMDARNASGSFGWQHRGLGRRLMRHAEITAKNLGKNKIIVTSGIGARAYYRALGYIFEAPYMVKNL